MTGVRWFSFAAVCLASLHAGASGFYFGDNGTKTMMQGGAFTAEADDLTAIQHNPAGLAQLRGLAFDFDFSLLNHEVSFTRQDSGFDPAAPNPIFQAVHNKNCATAANAGECAANLYKTPVFGISYGFDLGGVPITIGGGFYGPPATGAYDYGDPDYTKDAAGNYVHNPKKYAANRYSLIKNDIIIAYPTLSLAVAPHPRVMIGASLQLMLSSFKFSQAMYTGDSVGLNPQRALEEDPGWDAIAAIDLVGRPTVTGIIGLLVKPTDWLSFGGSVRPPIPVLASGKFDISVAGDTLKQANATVIGNQADLAFTMPLELRLGARVVPFDAHRDWFSKLGVDLDFVYQGWNALDAQRLTPHEVYIQTPGSDPKPVPPFIVPKQWRGTWSARVGGGLDVLRYLTVHAGFWYETMAAPDKYYNIDFANPDRFFVTGGFTGHIPTGDIGTVDVLLGFVFTPAVTKYITDSDVRRGQSDRNVTPGVCGSGIYTSGGWIITMGLRGHWDWVKPSRPHPLRNLFGPAEAPAPAPATDAPAQAAPATT